jgi:hypothetical protein
MKIIFLLFCFTLSAYATENDKLHLPKAFSFKGSRAVFADFKEATYLINYDVTRKEARVEASIKLETFEDGFPIFDSVVAPTAIFLNAKEVRATETKTPQNETTVRVINAFTPAGTHDLKIDIPLATLVDFSETGVRSAFWTSDLSERRFLEAYMPANFEFDQVKMTFIVKFIGLKGKQVIYTNGEMSQLDETTTKITYPSYYTASSIFFHTVPEGAMVEERFTLKSIDGREIPTVIYFAKSSSYSLERLRTKTTEIFHELESDYGAFPHPTLTIYQAGLGGMEYCGATMTEMRALGHELFHSYFARGVMPANGNAGWIDEALASWRDEGYRSISTLLGSSGMSTHPYYTRTTDRAAYSFGERFMSYLDNKLKSKGGLKPFMRYMVDKKVFTPFFIEEFILEMSSFYGVSLMEDFKRYTFGRNNFEQELKSSHEHHIHRKMSVAELKNYL